MNTVNLIKLIGKNNFTELNKKKPVFIIFNILKPYFLIILSFSFYYFLDSNFKYILVFISFLFAQRYLQTLVHDSSHYFISNRKKINDIISNLFISSLIGMNIQSYRKIHFKHHVHNGSKNDPEFVSKKHIAKNNLEFLKYILKYILLLKSFGLVKKYFLNKESKKNNENLFFTIINLLDKLKFIFLIQVIFFILCLYSNIILYFIWIYLSLSFSPLISNLRFMVEHPDESDLTLSTKAKNFIDIILFAPLNFNYHYEHHTFPQLPPYNLKKFHNILLDNGFFNNNKNIINNKSYSQSLFES